MTLSLTLTLTLILTSNPIQEAKLGDQNKFYFDEKLGRWVEEGGPAPEAEAPLAPPPIIASANASSSALCFMSCDVMSEETHRVLCFVQQSDMKRTMELETSV